MIPSSLEGLEPARVFELFGELCDIPRGSGNEKAVSDYVRDFALALGLDTYQDEAWNLIIKKPATPGYENAPAVVLQAHLDMVCEKGPGVRHDFRKDPIRVLRDGDRIHADGTTLGADDGTGVAFAMCVLESRDIPHPALEVVLTSNEEAGMTGIRALDFSRISGRVIINLDCSDYGIVVGCAGTSTARMALPVRRLAAVPSGMKCWRLRVSGLQGGHSGLDITKERGNANVLLARFISALQEETGLLIAELAGGKMDNAITRESEAAVLVDSGSAGLLEKRAAEFSAALKKEFRISDPGSAFTAEPCECAAAPIGAGDTRRVLDAVLLTPSGVQTMSKEVAGLPETSGNIGCVLLEEDVFTLRCLYRSCFDSKKQYMLQRFRRLAAILGAEYHLDADGPEWEYKADNRLAALIKAVYKKEFGEDLVVEVSHGGNECGTFFRKFPDADIVCTGTQIIGAHTPGESVLVSVVQKEWRMLRLELAAMNAYGTY